jgi:phosphatidylglycerophosphate synthase
MWGAVLAWAAIATTVLAVHRLLATTVLQPVLAVAVFTLMLATAIVMMRDSHPFPRFGPANRVTLLRAGLVSVAAGFIVEPTPPAYAWTLAFLAAVVVALDGIDGWFARRTNMISEFGARFDMETDAFFMLVVSVLVWRHEKAGAWVMAIGLMRYVFVAAARWLPWLARPLRSTFRGKMLAVFALVALSAALAPIVVSPLSDAICAAALTGLAYSFFVDVRFLWRNQPNDSTLRA